MGQLTYRKVVMIGIGRRRDSRVVKLPSDPMPFNFYHSPQLHVFQARAIRYTCFRPISSVLSPVFDRSRTTRTYRLRDLQREGRTDESPHNL
jgi:hypothetical protein